MLKISEISLSFGGVQALKNISFEALQGGITGIIGPNGAGKTSLFNIISGFYEPQKGKIIFNNKEITSIHTDKRAGLGIARTFQNISLFRGMTGFRQY